MLIYGVVMRILPRQYTALTNSRVNAAIDQLSQELEGADAGTAEEKIYAFCIKYHSAAMLMTEAQSVCFGDIENASGEESSYTVSVALQFADYETVSLLTIVCGTAAAEEINRTFLHILPFVLILILAVSAVSAWLCSRAIVRPILKISHVSRRMAQMDMTWHCDIGRSDELGVLSDSLNTLSQKLTRAMDELESANERLRQEIETVNAIEKQRRDFFAAASHELKTPITILKGQIESMILEIGRYKDVKSVLPETLCEVESMERLVREILSIARLEIDGIAEETERIAVHEALETVLEQLAPLAREKNMEICENVENAWIEGSPGLFRKALHNVLSNAIRHSPAGSSIRIRLAGESLTVQNTGVTLPEEEISNLCTPFYRVEKSRSKATGGSGLGLYLVKTILELHHLPFSIANGENCVSFTIFLRKENETKTK